MKKIMLIVIVALFAAFNINAQSASIGKTAPDFELKDSMGKSYKLSDFKGKLVVLEWINYGCPFVKKHYDSGNMQKLQKKYTEKDVIWLAVCSSAPGKQGNHEPDEINEKSEEYGAAFTAYLIDEDGKTGKMYGAKTTPHMYIVDKEGNLVYAGGIDDKPSTAQDDIENAQNYVAAALDQLLAGKEVEVKSTRPYGCSVKY